MRTDYCTKNSARKLFTKQAHFSVTLSTCRPTWRCLHEALCHVQGRRVKWDFSMHPSFAPRTHRTCCNIKTTIILVSIGLVCVAPLRGSRVSACPKNLYEHFGRTRFCLLKVWLRSSLWFLEYEGSCCFPVCRALVEYFASKTCFVFKPS